MAQKGKYYMGDPNLPSLGAEFEYTPEMIKEITKCKNDVLHFAAKYFYIIDPDKGRSIIDLYKFQKRILKAFTKHRYNILIASRQASKTTLFTIFALWVACFNSDQNIVVVANKEATAKEIFRRIKLAYEELPEWLKPAVKEYAQTSATFANGTRISISTTTGSAARGSTVNLLIIDECAWVEPDSILEDFWRSVWPTISRSTKSRCLVASTPNGTGNLFHRLYTDAEKGENGFHMEKIMWDEIPGRGEKFKQEQIKALGSFESWLQEFCCVFLNTGDSSIDDALFEEMKQKCESPKILLDDGHYKIWEEYDEEKTYVAGVDTGEGVGQDYSVIQIMDITDLADIKQVATYRNNEIPPAEFSTKCYNILKNWGSPLALVERNNCGAQVVDRLIYDFGYERMVNYGMQRSHRRKAMLGVVSHTNVKYKAVLNERYWINDIRVVTIKDIQCLKEFKDFMRYTNGIWKAAPGKNDDMVMAMIFALLILERELTENYFEILELDDNGKPKVIEQHDLGLPPPEPATSIYTDNEVVGVNNNILLPVYFGESTEQITEMEDLRAQGYEIYGAF